MNNIIDELHELFNAQKRIRFPYDHEKIPLNGFYVLFEKGEKYKNLDRIVMAGSHTGQDRLNLRLNEHFIKENKERSILRKNIGRCLLNKKHDPYLKYWELETTKRDVKISNAKFLDKNYEKKIESEITEYIQSNFSFVVVYVEDKKERLYWRNKIASTLVSSSQSQSENWLGNFSTLEKIKQNGIWQVKNLNEPIINTDEFIELKKLLY